MIAVPICKAVLIVTLMMMGSSFVFNFFKYDEFPATWKLVAWAIIALAAVLIHLDEYLGNKENNEER